MWNTTCHVLFVPISNVVLIGLCKGQLQNFLATAPFQLIADDCSLQSSFQKYCEVIDVVHWKKLMFFEFFVANFYRFL